MKQFFLILLCSFWAGSVGAKVAEVGFFELENGLEVAVIENHKAPLALQMLYYKTGSINDPLGKGGIAHLLEHLMFRGTKQVPDKEFNRLTDEYGAESNAYTTYNETGYYEFADISKLELMMALEADRMQNLLISEEAFAAERDIVLEERMQRYESNPVPLFYETLNKLLWQAHPMANAVSGSVAEIKNLTSDDARRFYQKWYRPNNALLVLSGDITLKEAQVLAKKYFGGIAGGEPVEAPVFEAGKAPATTLTMQLDGVAQPRFAAVVRLDAGMLTKREALALALLAEYLAGDDAAYLSERLVYGEKVFSGVDAALNYDVKIGGSFGVYAVPAEEKSTLAELNKKLDVALADGVAVFDGEALQKVKNRVLSEVVYLQENPESAARFVGGLLLAGYTADEVSGYDELVKGISVEEVVAAWQKVATAPARVSGYLEGK